MTMFMMFYVDSLRAFLRAGRPASRNGFTMHPRALRTHTADTVMSSYIQNRASFLKGSTLRVQSGADIR